tara:strand:- start:312 stop:761 length:450 start_codon:yes stop_codon:yes gene_type:complete
MGDSPGGEHQNQSNKGKLLMTRYSKIHLVVMLVTFLFCTSKLNGQSEYGKPFVISQTEIIPYRLVPSQDPGYGCWLEIELIGLPESIVKNEELVESLYRLVVQKETGEIGFNQDEFKWNNRNFVLVKIQVPSPYSVMPKTHEIEVEIDE